MLRQAFQIFHAVRKVTGRSSTIRAFVQKERDAVTMGRQIAQR
jgi:hypothetical protein